MFDDDDDDDDDVSWHIFKAYSTAIDICHSLTSAACK